MFEVVGQQRFDSYGLFKISTSNAVSPNVFHHVKFILGSSQSAKVPFCTFTDLNPGIGRPWSKLWISFVYGTFITPQK